MRNGEYGTIAWIKSPCGVTLRTYEQLREFIIWVKTARDVEKAKTPKEGEDGMRKRDSSLPHRQLHRRNLDTELHPTLPYVARWAIVVAGGRDYDSPTDRSVLVFFNPVGASGIDPGRGYVSLFCTSDPAVVEIVP